MTDDKLWTCPTCGGPITARNMAYIYYRHETNHLIRCSAIVCSPCAGLTERAIDADNFTWPQVRAFLRELLSGQTPPDQQPADSTAGTTTARIHA